MVARENNARSNYRAGRYIAQPAGYRAFMPAKLPPDPPVRMDDELWALLSTADRSLGRLDGATEALPDPDLFVFMYVRKEAVLSSQIEGTQASLADVLEAEADVLGPDAAGDVDEVINYVGAMNHGLAQLSKLPLSTRLIRDIHARLLKGTRGDSLNPGEFRTTQNWIGAKGSTLKNAAFIPPPPQEVATCMSHLERFIHDDAHMPLLMKVGLAHGQFETIHPFLDGNGRMGRLLITFMLCEQKALTKPLLYLSHYLKRHRSKYYDLLQGIRDNGDWESWLKFFLRGIAEVSDQATATARRIVQLREEHLRVIGRKLGRSTGNAHKVLEDLYKRPVVQVNSVAQLTGLAFPNANRLVARLVELGILKEVTGRSRNRLFRYSPYIALFED
jgi:Fic family protein